MNRSIQPTVSLAVLVFSGVAAFGGAAAAGPAYRASEVVAHFSSEPALGAARALCIGTRTECAGAVPDSPKAVSNFDLKVNFDYNSANLTPEARANLDEFVTAMRDPRLAGSRFLVEGHTDGSGSDAFNLDLSMRRAGSVVGYLMARGVDGGRLEAKGFGKQKPLVAADPMSPVNRRVETRLRTE